MLAISFLLLACHFRNHSIVLSSHQKHACFLGFFKISFILFWCSFPHFCCVVCFLCSFAAFFYLLFFFFLSKVAVQLTSQGNQPILMLQFKCCCCFLLFLSNWRMQSSSDWQHNQTAQSNDIIWPLAHSTACVMIFLLCSLIFGGPASRISPWPLPCIVLFPH